jgi:hypothetical protein
MTDKSIMAKSGHMIFLRTVENVSQDGREVVPVTISRPAALLLCNRFFLSFPKF